MTNLWKTVIAVIGLFALAGIGIGTAALVKTAAGKTLTCSDLGINGILSDEIAEANFGFNTPERVTFSDADLIEDLRIVFHDLTFVKCAKNETDGFLTLGIKTTNADYGFGLYGNVLSYDGRYYKISKNINFAVRDIVDTAVERHGTVSAV